MHTRHLPKMLAVLVFAMFAVGARCDSCAPPPPPPPDEQQNLPTQRLPVEQTAEGKLVTFTQADGGTTTAPANTLSWCSYMVTGPAGGDACFDKIGHICTLCPASGSCPVLIGSSVKNLPRKNGQPPCTLKIGGSTTAQHCGPCDDQDHDNDPFLGYFQFAN